MNEELKCVVVVNKDDTRGVIANTIACLSFGLGAVFTDATVDPSADKDGILHGGIIDKPIPVLSAHGQVIRDIFLNAQRLQNVHVLDMNNRAQEARTLAEYKELLSETATDALNYAGISLYGPKRDINKLTGSLKLLR